MVIYAYRTLFGIEYIVASPRMAFSYSVPSGWAKRCGDSLRIWNFETLGM